MPSFCCVVGCGSRKERDNVRFFRLPKPTNFKHASEINNLTKQRREKWLSAIKRADWTETKLQNARVCSKHFISGQPSALKDIGDPDWAPCQNMGYTHGSQLKTSSASARWKRLSTRQQRSVSPEAGMEDTIDDLPDEPNEKRSQTDVSMMDMDEIHFSKCEKLEKRLLNIGVSIESFNGNNLKTKYYTGLESFDVLMIIYNQIQEYIHISERTSLNKFQILILTFMKLRLNIDYKDLGFRFGISTKAASSYFHSTLDILYNRFRTLVFWPDRELLLKTMPSAFLYSFKKKVTVIIDCFEIFIERPGNIKTAAQCWSNYKHHHTIKFLIGITPQGMVCYISEAWGGRTSDKYLTENSTFFDNVVPGDVILADRGFLIHDYVHLIRASIEMPAFTKGRNQLHPLEVENNRSIAHVRIHVERVIGLIKNKFKIVKGPIPITTVKDITKIVSVCCSLINLCSGIVPE